MASFLAAAVTHAWPLLIPGFLLLGFSLLSSPASQAILAESVKMEPRKMGIVFSWVFFFNSIPGALMAFVAGVIGDAIGYYFFFQAEDGIRDLTVTGVQTCALPI